MEPLENKQPDNKNEQQRPRPLRPLVRQQTELEPKQERHPVRKRDEDRVGQDYRRPSPAEDPVEGRHRH